ncbi:MAG: OadG family protein [Tannerella sp.]|jgi:oxaloacetate decarboxylase gamma subunit|nr:OadG family protein [Tannerella sp.]
MENLGLGFLLMCVGMITVFTILLIVIGLGNLLILWVNRYSPQQPLAPIVAPASTASSQPDIPDQVIVAIVSAVSITTEGKGRVTAVRKQQYI